MKFMQEKSNSKRTNTVFLHSQGRRIHFCAVSIDFYWEEMSEKLVIVSKTK